MIDFKRMEEIVLPEFYGGRGELKAFMYVDDLNRILKGRFYFVREWQNYLWWGGRIS